MNTGVLIDITNTFDTFAYRALTSLNNIGMASAVTFYQAIVGFVLVVVANLIVRRIDKDSALF